MEWKYDENDASWKFGTATHGAGVYLEGDEWFVNVCYGNKIVNHGPFITREEACSFAHSAYYQILHNQ